MTFFYGTPYNIAITETYSCILTHEKLIPTLSIRVTLEKNCKVPRSENVLKEAMIYLQLISHYV